MELNKLPKHQSYTKRTQNMIFIYLLYGEDIGVYKSYNTVNNNLIYPNKHEEMEQEFR